MNSGGGGSGCPVLPLHLFSESPALGFTHGLPVDCVIVKLLFRTLVLNLFVSRLIDGFADMFWRRGLSRFGLFDGGCRIR